MLPQEIIHIIISFIGDPITLLEFCKTNHYYSQYLQNISNWKFIWNKIIIDRPSALTEYNKYYKNLDYKIRVRLAGFTGCMFCNNKKIRKVYWEHNVRSCKNCMIERTISDYYIPSQLDKNLYINLPHNTIQMYTRYNGYFTVNFYWKKTIDDLLLVHCPPPPPPTPPTTQEIVSSLLNVLITNIEKNVLEEKQKLRRHSLDELHNKNNKLRLERINEMNNLCEQYNIAIIDADKYSQTYIKNKKVTNKLGKTIFIKKIPIIIDEIRLGKEKENELQERIRSQKEFDLFVKHSKEQSICPICNTNRIFKISGLFQHIQMVHKNINITNIQQFRDLFTT